MSLRKLGVQIGVDIVGRCGDFSDGDLPPDHEYRYHFFVFVFVKKHEYRHHLFLFVSLQLFCLSKFITSVAKVECCAQREKTKWMLQQVKLELSDSIWHLRTTIARIT